MAREAGARHCGLALEVTDALVTRAIMTEAALGPCGLAIVCANASLSTMNRGETLILAEWHANIAANAKAAFLANQAANRHWLADGQPGVIVNTASLADKIGARCSPIMPPASSPSWDSPR
ncbi:short chain dehydrogenase [Arboricoccus pini]|uniref:Short chain dehydrogenase n=1 Tax=Arboricoccus pini TaxID=1963835 RepID=A0A212RZ31_9PROT|nr:SDR family NAD(P)-dependent oxidoreductase [Arboricoccus pini]SNB77982.1 short chain dehydrogenase [Arboricoccus pini]